MSKPAKNKPIFPVGWIVIYTKPNQEKTAIINIERQGFKTYCPMIESTRKHTRKNNKISRPLFPSYVFVHLDEKNFRWRPLLSTTGVLSVICFNDRPGFVPRGFVEELQEKAPTGMLIIPQFPINAQVKILDGHFQGLIAKIISLPEKDRIWLLLDIMGRKVRVQQNIWSLIRK